MNKYVIDGTILFIREPTGKKLTGFRIPSFKETTNEKDEQLYGFSTDISSHVPNPVSIEIDEYTLRPATEAEYKEWQALDAFTRCHSTDLWRETQVFGGGIYIEGVTVRWKFDYEQHPTERTPSVEKTNLRY